MLLKALKENAFIKKGNFYEVHVCKDNDNMLFFRVIINKKTCQYYDIDYRSLCYYFEGEEVEEPEPPEELEFTVYVGQFV